MTKALVIFSGGQDSTTCLGWALDTYDEVSCITFDYGQRHAMEMNAARRVIAFFEEMYKRDIPHELVKVPDILKSASPLTDKAQPLETYTSHGVMAEIIGDRVEKTFVPMRNTLFLTVAANRAVAAGIRNIVTGVCQEDNANYPDCTAQFIGKIEDALNTSLDNNYLDKDPWDWPINIDTPLIYLSKADTVRLALDTPYTYAALSFSHTAYDGQYPPTGKDHASVLRAYGFEQADRPDPLVLRAVHEGRMPLPLTHNYRPQLADSLTEAMRGFWS